MNVTSLGRNQGSDNADYQSLNIAQSIVISDAKSVVLEPPRDDSVDWETAVDAYIDSALDSTHTRRAYRRHLMAAKFAMGVETVGQVTGAELASYRAVVTNSNLALASQRQALAALRSFLTWVTDLGGPGPNRQTVKSALRTPKGSDGARYSVLREHEVEALLSACKSPRDLALGAIMLGSGLRVSEVAGLRLADVVEDIDGGMALHVKRGKGRKDRTVPVGGEVVDALKSYLTSTNRYIGGTGPLFLANDRGAQRRAIKGLSTRAISRIVRDLARCAGISAKRISPHSLRHSYAIRALRAGGNVVAVSKLLGHSSIATTQRYVDHLAVSELRSTVPALPMPTALNGNSVEELADG